MMPQLLTLPIGHDPATRRERTSAVPLAVLRGHDLTVAERSALLDCYANSDRTFLEIATTHGVDREHLQELWFDLFLQPPPKDLMMSHIIKRRGTMPAESIVYRDWKNGVSRTEMAERYGVSEGGMAEYLRRRVERWHTHPPAQIATNARKIVRTVMAISENGYREIQISLPRISMHVKAMEARL